MIDELRRGELPDRSLLARRFAAAVTKKMAVVALPPALWPGDPKINPPAEQLYWAALVLGDPGSRETAGAILAAELSGRRRLDAEELHTLVSGSILRLQGEFLAFAPNDAWRRRFAELITATSPVTAGLPP